MQKIVEAVQIVPLERILGRIVEQMVEEQVPQILDEIVENSGPSSNRGCA